MGGRLLVDLAASGSVESPEFTGNILISDGTFENVSSGTILKEIQINGKLVREKLVVEEARASDGGKGNISGEGWLRIIPSEQFPFQLDLTLDNCALLRRDDLFANMEGRLSLSGTVKESKITGSFTVGPAEIRIPDRLPTEVPDLEVVEINRPVGKEKEEYHLKQESISSLNLDLAVDSPGRVFIRGRGLDSEWSGKLHITGNSREPVIAGNLSVVRGRYNFLGKPFSLVKGLWVVFIPVW